MNEKRIIKLNVNEKAEEVKLMLPKGHFESEWFRCRKCGHEVQILTPFNTATCSKCGSVMDRI